MKKFLRKGLALAVSLTMLLSAHVVYAEDTATQPSDYESIILFLGPLYNTPAQGKDLESDDNGVIISEFNPDKLASFSVRYANSDINYKDVYTLINGYDKLQLLMQTEKDTFVDVSKTDMTTTAINIKANEYGAFVFYINPTNMGTYTGSLTLNCNDDVIASIKLPTLVVNTVAKPTTVYTEEKIRVDFPQRIANIHTPLADSRLLTSFENSDLISAAKGYNIVKANAIDLFDVDNNSVTFLSKVKGDKVKVSIPFKGEDDTKYTVLKYEYDDKVTVVDSTYANSTISFETDESSIYAIATSSVTKANNTATTKVPVPQTSEESPIALVISLSLAGIILLFIRKKYINNCNS